VLETGVVGDEAARATAVANLLGGRVAWDSVFRDLARVLPENVWLSSLSVSQPSADSLATTATAPSPLPGQPAATPTAVSIEGYTYSQPDVALLLARLSTLPSLQRVTLNSRASELVGSKPAVHFVIVADLSQPGGAS
jgi:Tfp pilus assembly protein PilN